MSTFFGAILAGLVWMGLTADLDWVTFAVGAVLGLLAGRFGGARARRPFGPVRAIRLTVLGARVLVVFLWELAVAAGQQLRIVLAPRVDVRPAWIRFPCQLETPALRALLGAMLSLTPGSLTYEESAAEDGGWTIALHVLDVRDEEKLVRQIRTRLEAPLRAMEEL